MEFTKEEIMAIYYALRMDSIRLFHQINTRDDLTVSIKKSIRLRAILRLELLNKISDYDISKGYESFL